MYATQPGAVVAVDARTGRLLWRSTRQRKVRNPYEINPFNRGAAIAGDRSVRRHARRGARGARCQDGQRALGNAGRRLDARLQPHQRAPRGEGQGSRRHHRRGIRRARLPRRVRHRHWPTGVALVFRSGARRVRQRHVEGRQLDARRQPDVADRLLRSRVEHRLLGGRESRARRSIAARAETATTCSATRSSPSIPTPARASGTTSSRPTTVTTGIRRRRWCSSIASGTGSRGNC